MTGKKNQGFTIMELLLVLLMIALLASIVMPVVTKSIHRAKESALKENLFLIRKAIDDYYTDNGHYPHELEILVEKRYIRNIPKDSVSGKKEWQLISNLDEVDAGDGQGIIDIRSLSEEKAMDGSFFNEW